MDENPWTAPTREPVMAVSTTSLRKSGLRLWLGGRRESNNKWTRLETRRRTPSYPTPRRITGGRRTRWRGLSKGASEQYIMGSTRARKQQRKKTELILNILLSRRKCCPITSRGLINVPTTSAPARHGRRWRRPKLQRDLRVQLELGPGYDTARRQRAMPLGVTCDLGGVPRSPPVCTAYQKET
jgi:hypothetical protein